MVAERSRGMVAYGVVAVVGVLGSSRGFEATGGEFRRGAIGYPL